MSFVSFNNVSKAFGTKNVIERMSFELKKGASLAIMGPSGSGKTTIINLLLGFELPDHGKVKCADSPSVVFQEDRLCEDFSALSNVAAANGVSNERAFELLSLLDLSEDAKTPVKELSGGMRRRVAIARALAVDAEFYIFDEPFKGLDKETRLAVMKLVKEQLKGKTFLLITHSADEAGFLCEDLIVLGNT